MGWDLALAATATYAKPEPFETFRRHIDPVWIELARAATGTATVRQRRLPVEEVVWVVLEMQRVATSAKVEPTCISFVESLRLIRDEWLWLSVTSPGAIPKRLASVRANIKRYILPPRRPKRLYPRAVKIKMSNYERKRPRVEAQAK